MSAPTLHRRPNIYLDQVTPMVLDERMGHGQAQILPPLEPRADAAANAITDGLVARANHLVFFLLDLAAELDLEAIHSHYRQKDPRGEKVFDDN